MVEEPQPRRGARQFWKEEGRGEPSVPGGGQSGWELSPFLHQSDLSFLTVQLSLPSTMHLGGLPRKYTAAQLHLHWGQKGSQEGSEHQINSEATVAEVPTRTQDAVDLGERMDVNP